MPTTYETIIGLEIHVQLKTKSKLFCSCDNAGEDQAPNTTICEICTAQPGTLPVPNQQAIDWAVRAALAFNASVAPVSKFDRKHYFYPDLPKGFQISQYDQPIGQGGHLDIELTSGPARIRLERLHLEEDSAKLLHEPGSVDTRIDFNRAGTPLIEIVTKPDLASPEAARVFLRELRAALLALGVSDADMEKGHLRVDANISLRPEGDAKLYPKTEIKNLNSFRAVERALAFEGARQTKLWEAGKPPSQLATRGWEETKGETIELRVKEEAADYRYFPEPDIPPLHFSPEFLQSVAASLPEMPAARRQRFQDEYSLTALDAESLVAQPKLADYAESVVNEYKAWLLVDKANTDGLTWESGREAFAKLVANWLLNRFSKRCLDAGISPETSPITPENFAEFLKLIQQGSLKAAAAQQVFDRMFETGGDPSDIVASEGLGLVSDESAVLEVVLKVIDANPKEAEAYRKGKIALLKFFVGQVMKATGGRADPEIAERLLAERLGAE